MEKITAQDVLLLLMRCAAQFLGNAWALLGQNKKIVNLDKVIVRPK